MAITLNFACNDPDNGNFIGKFDKMEVDGGDLHMEFECSLYPSKGVPVSFKFPVINGDGTARVGKLKLRGLWYKPWYGNWCWDAVWFSWVDALAIINYVGKLKYWRMTEGPCALFEAFNERHKITPMEWKAENEASKLQNLES